jgi:IS605 OrfB family transposase
MDEMTLTYQTRLLIDKEIEEILQTCACLLSTVERSLYAEVAKGQTSASCKNTFLKEYGITARQFNACRISLEGKLGACRAAQEQSLFSLGKQIKSLDFQIQLLEKKPSKAFTLHQKKRRKSTLASRLSSIEDDLNHKRTRLCFGGKKLFSAQYHLDENGFASHEEWKQRWEDKRNSEFFILGSKDETAGNQTCRAFIQEDGKLTLRLRLPPALEGKRGKYLEIKNVEFAYGQKAILEALQSREGQAISYRFKKDAKSWKVFASTATKKLLSVSKEGRGVIGIDLNLDHIALAETDRFGNLIRKEVLPWISHGKTKNQLKALTADICRQIVDLAKETQKPLIIEKLDFQKKKLTLQEGNKKFARLLSSFAYGQFFLNLQTRSFKNGIEVHTVNPAFTSVIGCVNYAKRYGLSSHLAAAFCIARRYQKLSESPSSSQGRIPNRQGSHVAFALPARNRTKHVWHFWGQVKKKAKTVLAAHNRATRYRSQSPP